MEKGDPAQHKLVNTEDKEDLRFQNGFSVVTSSLLWSLHSSLTLIRYQGKVTAITQRENKNGIEYTYMVSLFREDH